MLRWIIVDDGAVRWFVGVLRWYFVGCTDESMMRRALVVGRKAARFSYLLLWYTRLTLLRYDGIASLYT